MVSRFFESGQRRIRIFICLNILAILTIPHMFFVVAGSSSLGVGLLVVTVFMTLASSLISRSVFNFRKKNIIKVCLLWFLSFVYVFLVSYINDNFKPLYTFFAFLPLFFYIPAVATIIRKSSFRTLILALKFAVYTLVFLGFVGIFFDFGRFNYGNFIKPVFPFSEPSHYALAVGIVAVPYSINVSYFERLLLAFVLACQALLLPSLVLWAYVFIIFILDVFYKYTVLKTIIYLIFSVVFLSVISLPSYYLDRLDFMGTTNLSALVYLNGWDLAINNVHKNFFTGLGFQMLGHETTSFGVVAERTAATIGSSSVYDVPNIKDGGFLAAKIIAEFGLFSLLVIIPYISVLIRSLISLDKCSSLNLLKLSMLVAFAVEFFFRGYGYFSPGLIILLTFLLGLRGNLNSDNIR